VNEPSITTIDQKVNSLISTVEKLADTVSNLNTVHTELNHVSEKITKLEGAIESSNKDIRLLNDKVIVNSIQAEEYKHIKKAFITFIVVAVLGGGYMTKTTTDNSLKQAEAMAEIVIAIKESVNKGK